MKPELPVFDKVIIADAVFDPESGFVPDARIAVTNGLIAAIGAGIDPGRADVLDCARYAVTPLFCDYHLHFFPKHRAQLRAIESELVQSGVGYVYEGGDENTSGLNIKNESSKVLKVSSCGQGLYYANSYGKSLGISISTSEQARQKLDELILRGIDYVKLFNSGIFLPETGAISSGGFRPQLLGEIVDYAHARGLSVFCHANGETAIRDAIAAGVDTIIHGFQAAEESLRGMAESKIALIPTLAALTRLSLISKSDDERTNVLAAVEQHTTMVGRAFELGVTVLPGSDAGAGFIPYGIAYLEELEHLRHAGIPVESILGSAVKESLRVGMAADFVILDDARIKDVVIGGNVVNRT